MHTKKLNKATATILTGMLVCSNVGSVVYANEVVENIGDNVLGVASPLSDTIVHAQDAYVELGATVDLLEGVTATDSIGDISSEKITLEGRDRTLDTTREGMQTIVYKVIDNSGATVYHNRTIFINKKSEVKNPKTSVDEYGVLTITDEGVNKSFSTNNFTNKDWSAKYFTDSVTKIDTIQKGDKVIASSFLNETDTTTTDYVIDVKDDKATLNIGVSVAGVDTDKVGKVLIDDEEVYNTSNLVGVSAIEDTYMDITQELTKGSHKITFEFSKNVVEAEKVVKVGDTDRMYIHSMGLKGVTDTENLLDGIVSSTKLQYRINNGAWTDYTSPVDLKGLATMSIPLVSVDAKSIYSGDSLGESESTSGLGNDTLKVPILVAPTLIAIDKEIEQGSVFNEKEGISAKDVLGKDITSSIEVISNNVDTKKPGEYNVTYRVTTKTGAYALKTVKITVKAKEGYVVGNLPEIVLTKELVEIQQNSPFSPLDWVSANDKEDGVLTGVIKVLTNTVDTKVAGDYIVVYEVEDKDGNKATKTLNVKVLENKGEAPTIEAKDIEVLQNTEFDPLKDVIANDKEDGVITGSIKVIRNTVDTTKVGVYDVEYEVEDSNKNKTTKTIKVTVKENTAIKGEVPIIHAEDKTVTLGTVINVLDNVTATDKEDGNITDKIEILSNPLDTSKEGTYTVQLGVKDSDGNITLKNVVYTVVVSTTTPNTDNTTNEQADVPTINAVDVVIPLGMNMAYILEGITANDKIDGTLAVQVKSTNIDFNKAGDYKLVLYVKNARGIASEKEINVKVSATAQGTNGNESANQGSVGTPTPDTSTNTTNTTAQEVVKTSDNIMMYLGSFIVSLVSSVGIFFRIKKK